MVEDHLIGWALFGEGECPIFHEKWDEKVPQKVE